MDSGTVKRSVKKTSHVPGGKKGKANRGVRGGGGRKWKKNQPFKKNCFGAHHWEKGGHPGG